MMDSITTNEIKISVRNLVEFIERSGDLDNRIMGSSVRAVEGTRAHQKVQRSYGSEYTPEVTLKYSAICEGYPISIEGRADGVLLENELITIDEIKSTTKGLDQITGENNLHWGQVKCYGYIYCAQNYLEDIQLQLTYYNIDSGQTKIIVKSFTKEELEGYLYGLLRKYSVWIKLVSEWKETRNGSIENLRFPFPSYRKGQREFAVAAYKTIKENKKGFFQAPTGIGKTISTLFPTVKAMGEDRLDKVFYLTAKTITRQVAEEAVHKMTGQGLRLKSVTLTAKDKICFMEESNCNPEYCKYAQGHFDRVNDAILSLLTKEDIVTRETILKHAQEHIVCPFELSLDLAIWSDCVICDYNHAFDPRVYLKRFFDERENNYVFLVDEAHNLVDRAREMFSCDLNKRDFLDMKNHMKDKNKAISKALNKINSYFVEKKKELGENPTLVQKEEPEDIYPLITAFLAITEEWLQDRRNVNYTLIPTSLVEAEDNYNNSKEAVDRYNPSGGTDNADPEDKKLLELFFKCHQFMKISEFYGDNFVTYIENSRDDLRLKIFCLDPARHLREAMGRSKATILFSATLNPITYYKDVLGGCDEDYILSLPSPFDNKNLLVMSQNISTYYNDRDESIDKISDAVYQMINSKEGNYFAFFPSYAYLNQVYESFTEEYPHIKTIIQEGDMNEDQRDKFLKEFQKDPKETLLAFAVMGGIFSEGIDLVGDRLIGTVIIGVGLPQLGLERDLIMEYYNQDKRGFEYSYMYPGFNKVLQSAGRVIRTESDKGTILLLDKRYNDFRYRHLFPGQWSGIKLVGQHDIEKNVIQFWKSHG